MFRGSYEHAFAGDERWRSPTSLRALHSIGSLHRATSSDLRSSRACSATPNPYGSSLGARVSRCSAPAPPPTTSRPPVPSNPTVRAGRYVGWLDLAPLDWISYGARRGNHEVMVQGTFANVRQRNRLAPGTEAAHGCPSTRVRRRRVRKESLGLTGHEILAISVRSALNSGEAPTVSPFERMTPCSQLAFPSTPPTKPLTSGLGDRAAPASSSVASKSSGHRSNSAPSTRRFRVATGRPR